MRVTRSDDGTPVWRIRLAPSDKNDRAALIDPEGVATLEGFLEAAYADDACRVIVLEGSPGQFCLGMHLAKAAATPEADLSSEVHRFADCLRLMRASPKYVISAVDGAAMGGGLGLATAADVVIATEASTFGLPEVVLGLLPAVVLPILLERLPPQKARLVALSSSFNASVALGLGLIDRVVPDYAKLERALRSTIKHALRCQPAAVDGLKRLDERIAGMPLAGAVHVGASVTTDLMASPDTANAITAFLEGEPLPWFDRYRPPKEK